MKVVHVCPVTPHRCGMYETARELAAAERRLGVDAYLFDPRPPAAPDPENVRVPVWTADRGVCTVPIEMALSADILVSHSGLGPQFDASPAPRVHIAHGRPNSSYRIERSGETPIYTFYAEMTKDPRWRRMVTFWPGFEHYWRLVFPRVTALPAFVGLEHWRFVRTDYDFEGHAGRPNVLVCDIWRKDKDPFHVLHAAALFAERYPQARIHVLGMDGDDRGRKAILEGLRRQGVLGLTKGLEPDLLPAYCAADLVITPHNIATRVVREALACGTQVVAGMGNPFTPYTADPEDLPAFAAAMGRAWEELKEDRPGRRRANRLMAQEKFNPMNTAKQFVKLLEEELEGYWREVA